jgi:hypothetical protein
MDGQDRIPTVCMASVRRFAKYKVVAAAKQIILFSSFVLSSRSGTRTDHGTKSITDSTGTETCDGGVTMM